MNVDSNDDGIRELGEHFSVWEMPEAITDELAPNLFGLTLDTVNVDGSDRYFVYVSGWRTGMHVLEFLPDQPLMEDRFEELGLHQVTFHASQIRIHSPGQLGKRLFLADNGVGFSVLEEQP